MLSCQDREDWPRPQPPQLLLPLPASRDGREKGNPHVSLNETKGQAIRWSVALEKGNTDGPSSEVSSYSQSQVLPRLEGLSVRSASLCIYQPAFWWSALSFQLSHSGQSVLEPKGTFWKQRN